MKITDYQKVVTLNDDDIFLLDGLNGTKTIEAKDLAKEIHRRSKFYDMLDYYEVPVEVRRRVFRGSFLGVAVTDAQFESISGGTFKGIFLGDYWAIDNRVYRIVDFNYWWNRGDYVNTNFLNYVVIMPDNNLYNASMNDDNTTNGGYVGSKMYTTNLQQAKDLISSAFGSGHILSHREYFVNGTSNGKPQQGDWYDSLVDLPNEYMMYGHSAYQPVPDGSSVPINAVTIDCTQLSLMSVAPKFINASRDNSWLRDVVSTTRFALNSDNGSPNHNVASAARGVRPVFGVGAAA